MRSPRPAAPQPFWKDQIAPERMPLEPGQRATRLLLDLIGILWALPVLIVPALILPIFSPLLAWLWVIWSLLIASLFCVQFWRSKRLVAEIAEIQARAKARTGAVQIGSAIHVAGHPLLSRDQPVVLALQGDLLAIYGYDNPVPLDSLPITQLQSIKTVSYDDERIPHVEVIDSAAQALQLQFIRGGQTCTCVLRRMLKIRPIDWYHALQQARFAVSPISNSG